MHVVEMRRDPAGILIDFDNLVQENHVVTCQYLKKKNQIIPSIWLKLDN